MNRYFFLSALILPVVTFMPSCEEFNPSSGEPKEIVLNKKAAEIIEADQQFAFELFSEVCSMSEETNIMISPLSVSYALGMTFNGAVGETLDAFYDVLHFGELTAPEVNESYKDLMNQLIHLDDRVEFSIANSIWYREGYTVLDSFISINQTYFDAGINELDFSDPNAVKIINDWIEDKTNDKIQDMLDYIPPDAVMYLINAIYFNAKWKYEFDKDDTHMGNFFLKNGSTHRTDFMKVSGGFNYTSNDDFKAVELPYGDSTFSMVVLLPAEDLPVDSLVRKMDVTHWTAWFEPSAPMKVQVELPKFTYKFKDLLNVPLINLGLGIAFSEGADFSKINGYGGLFISRVIHQTFIDVQEEGTEAAAATIVELRETSSLDPDPIIFRADRPFLYVIKENSTGAILFMGKVGKPEYE
ncbi:MAG: serpin family protein [Bacteroidales bacterium]|nr:serpin family protein [Bacteroidales bacterium]MBN2699640.1 serpin family protein [Bacteroidales bacterium]